MGPFLPHNESVWSLGFTPDGRRLITSSVDHVTKIWDVATGTLTMPPLNNGGDCGLSIISEDGSKIYLGFKNGGGELWDLNSGERLAEITTPGGGLSGRSWAPDGQHVVVCTVDGKVRRLRLGGGRAQPLSLRTDRSFRGMAFEPDAVTQALWLSDSRARVLDVTSGREGVGGFVYPKPQISAIFLRPDLHVMLARIHPNEWQSWWFNRDGVTKAVAMPNLEGGEFAFSQAGDLVARLQNNPYPCADILSLRSGQQAGPTLKFDTPFFAPSANFDPLGRYLAVGGVFGSAKIWDVATGNVAIDFQTPNTARNNFVLFSPDGGRVATANIQGETQVWDAVSGRTISPVFERSAYIWSAEYSRDGKYLVTGDWEGAARVWNAFTGEAVGLTMTHAARVSIVHFSPDGKRVLTASADGTARVWDAVSGRPLTESLPHGEELLEASFNADGRFIMTRAGATQRVWSVPEEPGDLATPDWLLQLGTLCASKSLTPDGQFVDTPGEAERIDDLRRQLTALPHNAPYLEWGRWFLADPATRSIAPGFTITPGEANKLSSEFLSDGAR
ncbi:MAG: WD40 repeat domain-containing protein [Planctomycetaceae bacterium]|nr:WD40 repeat domain-containing protein [Planctomycetaceae bacterium]